MGYIIYSALTSNLLVDAFVFVVVSVIFTAAAVPSEEIKHLVLVKRKRAGVFLRKFVVIIEFTALTAGCAFFRIF